MFECPECHVALKKVDSNPGVYWSCPSCRGRAVTVSLLRRLLPKDIVNQMWQAAWAGTCPQVRNCPSCAKPMKEVPAGTDEVRFNLDVCTLCQTIWFDSNEYESLPEKMRELTFEERIPQEAREILAINRVRQIREEAEAEWEESNAEWWQWIIGFFGVPVESQARELKSNPWATWITALIILAVSLACFGDLKSWVNIFGLVPAEYDRYFGATFITSFFIHGDIWHLLCNLYFFVVFGDNVEEFLGWKKFIMLLVSATLLGDVLHTVMDLDSAIPCIGASGGVSGILAFYALQFPKTKLRLLVRYFYRIGWVRMPAWTLFVVWLLLQAYGVKMQVDGLSNVSALAHLGGVFAGLIFWALSKQGVAVTLFHGPVDYTKTDANMLNMK